LTKQELIFVIKSNIRFYRKRRELTQEALAEAAGISSPYCAQIESGTRVPTIYILHKIAEALDVSVETLMSSDRELSQHHELNRLLERRTDEQIEFLVDFIELMERMEWHE